MKTKDLKNLHDIEHSFEEDFNHERRPVFTMIFGIAIAIGVAAIILVKLGYL